MMLVQIIRQLSILINLILCAIDDLTTDPNVLKTPRVKLFISQLILKIQRRNTELDHLMFFTTMHNDILKPKL